MKYRPDIDGLRAVAVLSVVLFHAGVPWLPGGFVGVDVFFVISGYLITRILVEEESAGHYSIADFYVRRARRILPALYCVLAAVLLFGLLLLLPLELLGLSKSVLATTLFSSNFLFWRQSGYFDVSAELKPLLHTWSLAVEEQFYVLWPLLLVFFYRRGWSIPWATFALIGLSFALSCLFLPEKPSAVFFLLPGRAWELLIGAWIATGCFDEPKSRFWRDCFSVVGVILLAGSVLLLSKALPFPGWNALFPCVGAVLIIAAGKGAVVNRYLLSARPLVFVGLVSYSFYLWHWPILSYVRILNLGLLPPLAAGISVVLSFLLATWSWRFVENRYRRAGRAGQKPAFVLFKYSIGGLALCLIAGAVVLLQGLPSRISIQAIDAQDAAHDFNETRGVCQLNMGQVRLPDLEKCTSSRVGGGAKKTLVVWGDSHAEAMIPGITVMPDLEEGRLFQTTKTSCPPLIGAVVVRGGREYQECSQFNSEVIKFLRQRDDLTTIVLAARWPVYALETGFGVSENVAGAPTYSLLASKEAPFSASNSVEVFRASLGNTIDQLVRAGKKVIVVGAVPEMMFDVPSCVARKRMSLLPAVDCGLPQGTVVERVGEVNSAIEDATRQYKALAVFPSQMLCREGYCRVESPTTEILYYDHNHLSTAGARYVFSNLRLKDSGALVTP